MAAKLWHATDGRASMAAKLGHATGGRARVASPIQPRHRRSSAPGYGVVPPAPYCLRDLRLNVRRMGVPWNPNRSRSAFCT